MVLGDQRCAMRGAETTPAWLPVAGGLLPVPRVSSMGWGCQLPRATQRTRPMSSIPQQRLDRLVERWHTLQAALNAGPSAADFAKYSKEFSELDPVVSAIEALRRTTAERDDLAAMIKASAGDREMAALAEEELRAVDARLEALEHDLTIQLLPKDFSRRSQRRPRNPRRHRWR